MQDEDNYIIKVNLFRLDLPLIKPYKLSYNTFNYRSRPINSCN